VSGTQPGVIAFTVIPAAAAAWPAPSSRAGRTPSTAVGKQTVVGSLPEFEIGKVQIAGKRRRDDHDAWRAGGIEAIEQAARHSVIAEYVGRERELNPVYALTPLALDGPGVVHQHVDRRMARGVRGHECLDRLPARDVHLKNVHVAGDVYVARPPIGGDRACDIASLGFIPAREHQVSAEPT
jgi:hypothetical protein